jgi:Na+/H+ antiporter NhaC
MGIVALEAVTEACTTIMKGTKAMLWTILLIVLVLWALGAVASVGGGLIHLLLVVAGIIFIAQLLTGRRTV